MDSARNVPTTGWPLVGYGAVALFSLFGLELVLLGVDESGIRQVVRTSAQTSLVLFSAAFSASSLYQLGPGSVSRWMLVNRRYIGVSFAVSHYAHLAALITLARVSPSFRDNVSAVAIVGGGLGYVLLTAMVVTSFDRTAAALGHRRWSLLHKVGSYYLWGIFFQSYLPRMLITSLAYAPAVAMLLATLGIRLYSGWQARQPKRVPASGT